jgi:hypothetical protein
VIERNAEQRSCLGNGTLDDYYCFVVEIVRDEASHHRCAGGSQLRGFHDHRVSSGNRRRHWFNEKLDRVVPWSDDQTDTERLVDLLGACGLAQKSSAHALRFHPRLEVLEDMLDL